MITASFPQIMMVTLYLFSLRRSFSPSLSLVWHNSQTDRGNNSAQIQLDFIDD